MNIFNFLKPKTFFCVIECSHAGIRALTLRFKNNELTFRRFFDGYSEENIADLFKKLKLNKESNVLLIYDHSIATTFAGSVKLEKNNLRAPISEDDLRTFLAAATNQFFNRFREEARRRLATDEVNIILANNRFLNLNLDGKQVINPLGQSARFAELEMEQTFLSRHFWDTVQEYTQDIKNVFHIELAGAFRDILALLYPGQKVLFVSVFPKVTKIFSYGGKLRFFGAVSFPGMQNRGEFALGSDDLLELIESRFHVTENAARELLSLYVADGMSKHAKRVFEKNIGPYLARFELGILKFLKKEDKCVVLTDAPFLTVKQKIQQTDAGHINLSELASRLDLKITAPDFFPHAAFSTVFLSGIIAYLRRTGDNYLNGLAKERMKWLVPENSA